MADRFYDSSEGESVDFGTLEDIWHKLDPRLKTCAEESFDFGNGRWNKRVLKLNQVGMAQLIQHLDRHGFEIKRKELERYIAEAEALEAHYE